MTVARPADRRREKLRRKRRAPRAPASSGRGHRGVLHNVILYLLAYDLKQIFSHDPPAVGSPRGRLGDGLVLEAAERAPCQGLVEAIKKRFGRVPTGSHLARIRDRLDMRLGSSRGQITRCGADGKGFAGVRVAAGSRPDAESTLLPRGSESPHPDPLCQQRAGERRGPDDVFKVTRVVNGADIARTVEESGCRDEVAGMKRPRAARFRRPSTLLIDMSADSSLISPRPTLRGDAP